ncbi:MAG: hypothetical protein H6726_02855 [Sandaracinaceae bacterium]|nr:hypothetical protein [Myxococcales bacterium]MCB9656564.1 hypothetical protein [Sandaracinaceae bacterium]
MSQSESESGAASDARALLRVKVLHTAIWVVLAGAIVALPVVALVGLYTWGFAIVGLVLLETLVLLVNRWRCPLTLVAERYTTDRSANFDIFLPERLARWNKEIFGTLFLVGVVTLVLRWRGAM